MLRIAHSLDTRLTNGGKVVSLTLRPRSTPQKHYFSGSDTHFCYRLSKPQGLVRPQGLGKLKRKITSSGFEPATFRLVTYIHITQQKPSYCKLLCEGAVEFWGAVLR
jgi:hypothetical protein